MTAPVTAPIAADGTSMFTAATYVANNTTSNISAASVDEIFFMTTSLHSLVHTVNGVHWYTGQQSRDAHFDRVVGVLEDHANGVAPVPLGA